MTASRFEVCRPGPPPRFGVMGGEPGMCRRKRLTRRPRKSSGSRREGKRGAEGFSSSTPLDPPEKGPRPTSPARSDLQKEREGDLAAFDDAVDFLGLRRDSLVGPAGAAASRKARWLSERARTSADDPQASGAVFFFFALRFGRRARARGGPSRAFHDCKRARDDRRGETPTFGRASLAANGGGHSRRQRACEGGGSPPAQPRAIILSISMSGSSHRPPGPQGWARRTTSGLGGAWGFFFFFFSAIPCSSIRRGGKDEETSGGA